MSVRITRHVQRVLDQLAREPGTASQLAERAGLGFQRVLDIVGNLVDHGLIEAADNRQYKITQSGQAARRAGGTGETTRERR